MDGEVIQSPVNTPNTPADFHRRPIVILAALAIILVVVIILIGNWALKRQGLPLPPASGLTEQEKQQILASLRLPPGTPPLTRAEQSKILNSLKLPPNITPLTAAQKAEIMKSLR